MTPTQKAAAAHAMIIARAWRYPAFKARLLSNARAALKSLGFALRPGMTLTVVEDTDTLVHLVLPARPVGDLSRATLDGMAADAATAWPAGILTPSGPPAAPLEPYRPPAPPVSRPPASEGVSPYGP
jgi:hypothetical protein